MKKIIVTLGGGTAQYRKEASVRLSVCLGTPKGGAY